MKRTTSCLNTITNRTANEWFCLLDKKPLTLKPCVKTECGYGWFVSNWSRCVGNCTHGIMKRNVLCVQLTKEGHLTNKISNQCDSKDKPLGEMSCTSELNCNEQQFVWKASQWSNVICQFILQFIISHFY